MQKQELVGLVAGSSHTSLRQNARYFRLLAGATDTMAASRALRELAELCELAVRMNKERFVETALAA